MPGSPHPDRATVLVVDDIASNRALARATLRALPIPTRCVLTRVDRMIDIPGTAELLAEIPVAWTDGGHGFLVEPAGARFVAGLLAS